LAPAGRVVAIHLQKITGRKRAWGELRGANVLGRDEDGRDLIKSAAD